MIKQMNFKIFVFLISSLTALAVGEAPQSSDNLELIKSSSLEIEAENVYRKDNTRVYLDNGAIWASRDISSIEPEFKVSVGDEVVLKNKEELEEVTFSLKTNYGYYVKNWKLEVFEGEDSHLQNPIKTIEGNGLNNNLSVNWDGIADEGKKMNSLEDGKQLLFKVTLWDEEGNMDVSSVGIMDIVSRKSEFNLSSMEEDEENKRTYGEAELMIHNIPVTAGMVRFMGTNLIGVEKLTLADEEYSINDDNFYAEKYLPTDKYLIPLEVTYEDKRVEVYEIYVNIPERYLTHTGLADLYVGQNYVSGNNSTLIGNIEYDGDIYNRGRLAYFGMAKFSDKLRATAHIDTRENKIEDMFTDLHKSDTTSIFERVEDEDNFYPTYGDESSIKRIVNTQGKLFLSVDYEKSNYLWGNYNTGLTGTKFSQYNRSLYGAKASYRSKKTTSFGEDKLNVVGFASEPNTLTAHDEFAGTGGSLYFLQNGDVIDGSDKVAIKLVNSSSNLTEDLIYLREGKDYEIDNFQGRIILTRPLSDISADLFSTIIQNNPRGGFENYLVVDYEFVPNSTTDVENLTFGGRGKGWLGDKVAIGGTYVSEEQAGYDYEMKGVDVTLRATEGSYIQTEYSQSDGTQVDSNFLSYDGGLTFNKVDRGNLATKNGEAYRAVGVLSLYDLNSKLFSPYGNDVKVWYQHKDAEYSYASKDDNLNWESYGAEVKLRPVNRLQLRGRYSYLEESDIASVTVTDTTEILAGADFALTDKLTIGIEGKHIEELDNNQLAKGNLAGAKIEYEFTDNFSTFAKAQTTVDSNEYYEENELYTIGADARLTDDLKVGAEGSKGSRGHAGDAKIDYSVTDDYDIYAGYVIEEFGDSSKNNIILGQRANLTSKLDVYQENQFVDENNGKGNIESYGIDYEVIEDYKIGTSFQIGKLHKKPQDTERRSASVYQKFERTRLVFKNKFEYRMDESSETTHQYLTTNNIRYKLTDEYTFLGKFNYSRTNNSTTHIKEVEFTEASIGMAYRPVFNDRLNMLGRYTYLQDEDETGNRNRSYEDEESHIFEAETIYSYNARWDLGLKLAYKDKKTRFKSITGNNPKIETNIYLAGIKATYHVMNKWDLFSEYHWKIDEGQDEIEEGALIAINRQIGENFSIGLGYNFSTFDDNLIRDDYDAHGWFVNVVGKF